MFEGYTFRVHLKHLGINLSSRLTRDGRGDQDGSPITVQFAQLAMRLYNYTKARQYKLLMYLYRGCTSGYIGKVTVLSLQAVHHRTFDEQLKLPGLPTHLGCFGPCPVISSQNCQGQGPMHLQAIFTPSVAASPSGMNTDHPSTVRQFWTHKIWGINGGVPKWEYP